MNYHGNATVGGPALVRELTHLVITKLAVGPMNNNAYLLRCRATDEQLLLDAAAEPDRLLALVGDDQLQQVLTTHQHRDHWTALAEVVVATRAKTLAHEADAVGIAVPTDSTVSDGATVMVGHVRLIARQLVGHTPGSLALIYDDPAGHPHVWTGDCLFPGGVGNTNKDSERFTSLLADVRTKIFDPLPDETWVYPGHGDDTTLGAERPHLGEWAARGW